MLTSLKFGRSGMLAALGEIALIVIGILLALQIDQWNADRLDRQKEIEYLSFIGDGLSEDVRALEQLIAFNQMKGDTLGSMLRLLESGLQGAQLNSQLNPLMGTLTRYDYFTPNRVAFENLKSTDSLSLISDNDLQRRLTEYYGYERGLIGTSEHLQIWTRDLGALVAFQTIYDRWFDEFPELPNGIRLPMRSVEEVRVEVTPELAVHLFYIAILNDAQSRELELELDAAKSLLDLVGSAHDQLHP
ncbi:MAG: DUF6090 family protein [Pseudomonadota bacterium]